MSHRPTLGLAVLALLVVACTGADGETRVPATPARPASPPPGTLRATPDSRPDPASPDPVSPDPGSPEPVSPDPASPDPASQPASPGGSPLPTFDAQAITLSFEPFASGLDALTFLTHAGDGSGLLYALEQAGVVRVLEPDGSVRPQPLLDISDRVSAGGERGLLGLAFHPDYADNGRLFVHYTDSDGNTAVSEFSRTAEAQADPDSERRIFSQEQPFGNHNGGMIAFGPDGYLYISLGDGGGAGDPLDAGQDLGTPLAKLLRIDVDQGDPYGIPPDNPFAGEPDARPEIWAWGLRNPWRLSFDAASAALVIADVGQNQWEEVNVQAAGEGGRNYGWSIMEGPDCFRADTCDSAGLVPPVASYPLSGGHCAVVGGYTYRGSEYPALNGAYLFADYCSGVVWALDLATALETGEAEPHEVASAGLQPSAFGQDEDGELYLVGHDGEILRIGARPR